MSSVPQELRDEVVRRLERAIDERDNQLKSAEQDAQSLERALGALQGDMARQREALRQLEREQRLLGQQLEQERRQALERLESLRVRAEQQHRRLEAALHEAERRHREEWQALHDRIEELARNREQKERRTREAGLQALARAEAVRRGLDRGQLEAMDLLGDLAAADALLAEARAVAARQDGLAAEVLSAGRGAEEALLLVAARLERRRGAIESLSRALVAEADWLTALLEGRPMLDLPDQREAIELLLVPERRQMQAQIEAHVQEPAAALHRWNGHAARAARIEGARDLLGAEILRARKALPGALEHEKSRYFLDHIWDDLELRFGTIEDQGPGTEGVWADPEDHKSTYLYMLRSIRGEVIVEMPWSGAVTVSHEGRAVQRYRLIGEPGRDALIIGELARRWQRLAVRLANPNWDPDLPEGESP